MSRARLLVALPLLATSTAPLAQGAARPEGSLDVGGGYAELLSKPIPVGKRIDLPEGWFRVEEEGVEDRDVGSFTVAVVEPEAQASADAREPRPPLTASAASAVPAGEGAAETDPCRAERSGYIRELWKASGIEVEDPDALLEGLGAGSTGPSAGFYWFALASDPFRPLAWSSDLQARARELVRCVKDHAP